MKYIPKIRAIAKEGQKLRGDELNTFRYKVAIAFEFACRVENALEDGYQITNATRDKLEDIIEELEQAV